MSKYTDRIDMRFDYVPAASTDIRKTINRERRRLAELKAKEEAERMQREEEREAKVRRIGK